ncbi:MAG: hypothetical protein JNM84_09970 [Planctomycetes bacterium]|nr:hypothetical protein [Planctomycetota bacterium]
MDTLPRVPRCFAPLWVLLAAAPLGAQEPSPDAVDLRPLLRSGERFEVSEKIRWSDELVSLRLRAGDEVLVDAGASRGASALGFQRTLRIERGFEDALEAVEEREGTGSATRLARTWKQLEATLRVDEQGAERGRRVKRFASPLVGRTANLARGESGAVSASLRPKPPQQGQEPPAEPAAADLALCVMEARFESCLPAQPVAPGATWPLDAMAARALLGSLDGFPFPRAEGYPGGLAEEARQADPLAVFLSRAACAGNARLESADDGTATIAVELTLDLEALEAYRSQVAKPLTEDEAAAQPDAVNAADAGASQALPWTGKLRARGRLVFDRTRRAVQSCALTGELELRVEARGAEGPAQVILELSTKGSLERNARIFAVSS